METIPSTAETLPGASRGSSLVVSEIVTKKFIIKTHTFCLSENPLLAPGNVSAVEGIGPQTLKDR